MIPKVYLAQDAPLKANNNSFFNLLLDYFLCSSIFLLKIMKIVSSVVCSRLMKPILYNLLLHRKILMYVHTLFVYLVCIFLR